MPTISDPKSTPGGTTHALTSQQRRSQSIGVYSILSMAFYLPPPPGLYQYKVFISHAWDYKDDYDGVVNLLNFDRNFLWIDLSVPIEAPLRMLYFLKKSYRTIVRQLDERIAAADCVLVLAAMYFKHRGWIQSEIEAAVEFRKPIIAISPRGQERFPSELTAIAHERVGWTSKSIITAIRKLVGN